MYYTTVKEENTRIGPSYSEPVPNITKEEKENYFKLISWPNRNPFFQQYRSECYLKNIPVIINKPIDQNTPQNAHKIKQGWINDFFGCLQPVFSIIGKGVEEHNYFQDDWEISFEKITQLQFLGCGGQGAVFFGMLDENPVAVKKVNELKDTEIKNLRKLNHPNVVKFIGVCTQEPCFCIVMEFCPFGTLFNLLKDQSNIITINRVVTWTKQIANGMQYLHMQNIIHRDLKSPNVLIGDNEIIKISDFGTCRTFNGISEKMTFAGTVAWMAPEVIKEQACSEKVDVWSFGIVLWELLTCEIPYKGLEQSAIMYSVGSGKLKPHIPESCPDGFKLIMNMCWKINPKERPSFKLICNHIEIASVEILATFQEKEFIMSQKKWKMEIKTKINLFVEQFQKFQIEYKLKEDQLIKRRQMELKHICDVRELYDKKLEKVNALFIELNAALNHVNKNTQIKNIESINQNFSSLSLDYSLGISKTNKSPSLKSICTLFNLSTDSETETIGFEKQKSEKTSIIADAETQTLINDMEIKPNCNKNKAQTVILQQYQNDGERRKNYIKIHYMAGQSQSNDNHTNISSKDQNLNRKVGDLLDTDYMDYMKLDSDSSFEMDVNENRNIIQPDFIKKQCLSYKRKL
ncbi:unnamed protein product [Brassicogethes aeneus]|uniref:Protein kinase domain-containing protein n=1 Tax=Brassicogethes aeneus TaxID=1431903 RepID=A0A9P0ASA7_BRAAE|nr:unnamed protein product [Brassicogethes aeneus]